MLASLYTQMHISPQHYQFYVFCSPKSAIHAYPNTWQPQMQKTHPSRYNDTMAHDGWHLREWKHFYITNLILQAPKISTLVEVMPY